MTLFKEYIDRMSANIGEHGQILLRLRLEKVLNFSKDDEVHKKLSIRCTSLIVDSAMLRWNIDSSTSRLTEKELIKKLSSSMREHNTFLAELSVSGVLKFSKNSEAHKKLLERINNVILGDIWLMRDTGIEKGKYINYYRVLLQVLHMAVIQEEPEVVSTVVPQAEPEVKEPEVVYTAVVQEEVKEPEVKEPEVVDTAVSQEEPERSEAKEPEVKNQEEVDISVSQEKAEQPEVKKSAYSSYDEFGIDIGAIIFFGSMVDVLFRKAEDFLRKYIEEYNRVTEFKLPKNAFGGYNYKKLHHAIMDWLESVKATGSFSPLEDENSEELQWLKYYHDFHSIEEIRGMTSLIISGTYNAICPSPSKTNADRFQLGRWHCQKELVLYAAKSEIEEFGKYLWKRVQEV